MSYDLFISYSRRDNGQGCMTQLVERIKTDFALFAKRELVPFFDQQEIAGMQDWRQRILQGLRESRLLFAWLSPAYLQSEYCEWEFVEYLKYEIGHLHGFNGVAPIYFVEVPGWDSKEFEHQCAAWVSELRKRQYFDLRPWHDQGEEALREAAVQECMGKLNRQIVQTITRGERAKKSPGNVDAHNPHFIGRTANLRMLRENFVTSRHIGVVTAVNGVGGLGKTALAIEYAHAFAEEYGGGRWQVRCAGKDDLRLALAELSTPIGFEFTDDEKKNADLQFERTRRELKKLADARAPHRCLLLLDNVDRPGLLDPAQVARLNGSDWLHVLATTRLGENELHGAHRDRSFLAIDELPPDDALALIESYKPDGRFLSEVERDAAREIVRLLGCFTLAVESAAVYLGQFANDVTCAAFLARLKKEGLEGLDTAASQSSEGVLHGEKCLSATLQPTLERLAAPEKLALEFAALLPPDQVPLPWLRALVAKTFPEMERDVEPGYPDAWKNVMRNLFGLRLIQATDAMDEGGQPRLARVHQLIQQLASRNLSATELRQRQDWVRRLMAIRTEALRNTTLWQNARWELKPYEALANIWAENNHPDAARLVYNAGNRWAHLAGWTHAEPLLKRAVNIIEQTPGSPNSDMVAALNALGILFSQTNRPEFAEPLLRRALEVCESYFGVEDARTGTALNSLANLLAANRPQEAELLLTRALKIVEKEFSESVTTLAIRLNSLANLLERMDRLVEAEPLVRRALVIAEMSYGASHHVVVIYLNNLAGILTMMHRLDEAEALFRRALAIDEENFGPDHTAFACDLNSLAELLRMRGSLVEAAPLYQRALAINEKAFGPEHPLVASVLNNVGLLLMAQNNLAGAEPLFRRSLAIRETCQKNDPPALATVLSNLGMLLDRMKRLEEAEPFLRRALDVDERNLGSDHSNVARDLNNLACLLAATNRLSEAEPLMRRRLEIYLKSTVSSQQRHPFLQEAIASYTALLSDMGRNEADVRAQLDAVGHAFGIKFGGGIER